MSVFSHLVCKPAPGRASTVASLMAAVILLSGCLAASEKRSTYLGSAPAVSGNTLDRYNDLAVVPPNSENLSISYDYALESDPFGESVEGIGGQVWFFAQRGFPKPESFIHVTLGAAAEDAPQTVGTDLQGAPAETIRLGALDYISRTVCVDTAQLGETDAELAALVSDVGGRGHALSDSVFVRSFEAEKAGLDGKRLRLVFTRDVSRLGYNCDQLVDVSVSAQSVDTVIESLRSEAARSFEVIQ